jgi:TfoX/Sxy family transcriptional regulator of competence genes
MASSLDYLTYVLELLKEVEGITYKKMMGEFLLYKDGILFGGVYDNRFLVKKTESSSALEAREVIPYPSAKPMVLIDIENADEIKDIVEAVVADLSK